MVVPEKHEKWDTSRFKFRVLLEGLGEVGMEETFKIFAIATKEELKIGPLVTIPPDSIHSNTVNVRRIR